MLRNLYPSFCCQFTSLSVRALVLELFAPNEIQLAPWNVVDRLMTDKPEFDRPSSHFFVASKAPTAYSPLIRHSETSNLTSNHGTPHIPSEMLILMTPLLWKPAHAQRSNFPLCHGRRSSRTRLMRHHKACNQHLIAITGAETCAILIMLYWRVLLDVHDLVDDWPTWWPPWNFPPRFLDPIGVQLLAQFNAYGLQFVSFSTFTDPLHT
jgi:hypothetical protein